MRSPLVRNPAAMPLMTPVAVSHVQPAAGEIVQEEQRFRALHQDVVDAHCHQVDADTCRACRTRNASFSLVPTPSVPDTSTGFRYFFEISNSAPKPPMPREHFRAHGAFGIGLDGFYQAIARVDVHACVAVGKGNGVRVILVWMKSS